MGGVDSVVKARVVLSIVGVAAALAVAGWWADPLLPAADVLPTSLLGWRTVGSYFDRPAAWPGKAWTRDGRKVGWEELEASAGPSHCDWAAETFLTIGWPVGTRASTAEHARQYIRDPYRKVIGASLSGTWRRNPEVPSDAKDTGYRYGTVKLYLAPSDSDRYLYLIAPADSERWPRSDPMTACA